MKLWPGRKESLFWCGDGDLPRAENVGFQKIKYSQYFSLPQLIFLKKSYNLVLVFSSQMFPVLAVGNNHYVLSRRQSNSGHYPFINQYHTTQHHCEANLNEIPGCFLILCLLVGRGSGNCTMIMNGSPPLNFGHFYCQFMK